MAKNEFGQQVLELSGNETTYHLLGLLDQNIDDKGRIKAQSIIIARHTETMQQLIVWMTGDLGERNVKKLLDKLNGES